MCPPNGGWGWVIVLTSFLYSLLVLGFHNSFGVYHVSLLNTFEESSSKTAWLSSISYVFMMIFGPLSGMLTKRFGARKVSITGSVLVFVSILFTSVAPALEVLFFTHGFLTGLGSSLAYTPGMIMVSQYFTTKRSLATGIVMSGGAAGALLQTHFHQFLIDTLGWRLSLRVFSSLMVICIVIGFSYIPLNPEGPSSSVTDLQKNSALKTLGKEFGLWKDTVFLIWLLANGLHKFGYFIPYVHLVKQAVQLNVPLDSATNATLVLGVSSMVGCIIFGRICDLETIDRLSYNHASVLFVGLLYFFVPLLQSYSALMILSLLLGITDAGNHVLQPVLTFDLTGPERMPMAWGFMLTVNAVSCLGPPFAGWMNDITGSYNLGFVVAGALNLVACFVLVFIPVARHRARKTRRRIHKVSTDDDAQPIKLWTVDLSLTNERPPMTYVKYPTVTTVCTPELDDRTPSLPASQDQAQPQQLGRTEISSVL